VSDLPARAVVESPAPAPESPSAIAREFRRRLADGLALRPAGSAKRRPLSLLSDGYVPRYRLQLFDTTFYLAGVRQNQFVRFFVAYVVQGDVAWPRIFYKDVSLVWRSASHVTRLGGALWIGKGDITVEVVDGEEHECSNESTTDLPLELQWALEGLARRPGRIPSDMRALEKVLHRAPDGRIEAYADFTGPRRRAQAEPRNLVNRGRPVARFTRPLDPGSLRIASGYEPDFAGGVLEMDVLTSRMYGGRVRRFRILSRNGGIQYHFLAAPRHVWIIPAQATTTQLSSYGVRTIDVPADDDLFMPGFEYHFRDADGELVSQIPAGFAGRPSPTDDTRADASAWIEGLPVVQAFRREVLGAKGRSRVLRRLR
jgi:hypothetical protein